MQFKEFRLTALKRLLAIAITLCLIFTLTPYVPVTDSSFDAYAVSDPKTSTVNISYVGKNGLEQTVVNLVYSESEKTFKIASVGIPAPFMNEFGNIATYKKYGVIVYSGKNQVNSRLGLVKSGFTLDALKDYIEKYEHIPVGRDCDILLKTTDQLKLDLSEYDDVTRYCYPSFLMDGQLWGTSFDVATRTEVPIVFAIESHIQRDFLGHNTPAKLDAAIEAQKKNISDDDRLRIFVGQAHGNNADQNLGSASLTWINSIKFAPKYYNITAAGIQVTTGDGYLSAAAGETVAVTVTGKTPADAILLVKTDDGKYVHTSDAGGGFSFKMPKGAVSLSIVPTGSDMSSYVFIDDVDPDTPLYGDDLYKPEQGTAKMVSVSFLANGGTMDKNMASVAAGQKYGALPVPKRDGYTFLGWFTSSISGTKVTADTVVSNINAHVLYAHWEKTAGQTVTDNTPGKTQTPADKAAGKTKVIKKPAAVKITGIKNKAKKSAVITWKKVSNATGYQVFRATKKNGKYSKVATIKKGATVRYTNKKLKKGKTYYYKVRAFGKTATGRTQYGKYSKPVKIRIRK
jgi:uncharacterized repeat protein (TIGR02543 family)